jgi:two-component system OmpR family response regulator
MATMRLLLVEDEVRLAAALQRGLRSEGFTVDLAHTGPDGLNKARESSYDAIILDLMLPDMSGLDVCRRLRGASVWAPIVMLTARGAIADRVEGLDAGADDYLVKPFSFAELLARLRSVTRRGVGERPTILAVGDLQLDPAGRRVWRGRREVVLTGKEFAILHALMRRPGQVLSREQLLEHAWDVAFEPASNVVDVHVRCLREKVDRPFGVRSLETVRGVGYRLRPETG